MATTRAQGTPLPIPAAAQDAIVHYFQAAVEMTESNFNIRQQLLARDRSYYREQDQSSTHQRAKAANETGDPAKLQNITVPVVMPQVESALAYLAETFLTGYPIFGVVAPPAYADALGAMETLIGENSIRAAWPAELMKTLRDGLKYDLGAVEVVWERKKTFNITTPDVAATQVGTVDEAFYEGNTITQLSPYNLILDTRVSPDKNHISGEFAGYTLMLSRIETKKRLGDLDVLGTMNFREGFESASPGMANTNNVSSGYYTPEVNPSALLNISDSREFNWMGWAGLGPTTNGRDPIKYKNSYEYTVFYARIIPYELGISVSDAKKPQIWKFVILNRSVVVFAQRQTNAHDYLPIIICKPSNDGMGYQSKSFAENATPIQQIASTLVNSAMASQRRKVYDRLLYDPTKIRKQDIDNTSPVARIPVKNSQFGKGLADAVYQIPYRDDGVPETLQMAQQIIGMGDILNGQNRVQQGQFQKGNKTKQEFDTVMSNSNSRQKMAAIGLEYTFFTPLKEIIKSNILQFQPPVVLMNTQDKKEVTVNPSELRKALISFTLSDGLVPTDKLVDPQTFQLLMQSAQAIPSIQAEYDLMGMFAYMMKLKGAHWVTDFKRTPEQQQAQLQQMQAAAQASARPDQQQPPAMPDAGMQGAQ